ncbi:arylsulfatase [Roseiconus lacunae]|uniref:Arylsulfatase n=1 Tax=Roseiconus lacunae TaxID=2605694 RepID=A0ABT7PJZ5_9BACT|nr:arylsulfatase [Roseiconus lacunae]MDM4016601.1 arylsulfatase [Roseiconus lacunae]
MASVMTPLFATPSIAAPPPNVIVVMTDDQGYGEFSFNGNPVIETPSIDQLASQSVRLTDFHVAPMCTPTRGQLMSGLDAFRNAAINVSSGRTLLNADSKTMANVFDEAGYSTGIFGKWHLGDNYPFRPEDRGFDEALWFPSSHVNSVPDFWDNDYFADTYIRNGQRQKYAGYCTDVFFDEAINWMGKQADSEQPFFAYIALNSAHWPWFVPEKYRQTVRATIENNPDFAKSFADRPQLRDNLISFLAMGANIDDNVGKLNRFLDDQGLTKNTIVVFLTDNGSTFGHQYFNAGMRGHKTQLWEGGHRVPCLIRWPDVLRPRNVDDLTHVQDLLPTLADLADADSHLPSRLDGISLKARLTGQSASLPDRMLVINYSRMPSFRVTYTDKNPAIPVRNGAAVLWKKWRFLENRRLYDIDADPHQDRNIAADHPDVVAKLRKHLNAWWDEVKDDVLTPQRVIIGHPSDNPTLLTACEWLDVFVDQQVQIRRGVRKNGTWYLSVDRDGSYAFELRRWPRESGLKLEDSVAVTKVTDGEFPAGVSLPISKARLQIGSYDHTQAPHADEQAFTFNVELKAGPTEMKTWMIDGQGNEICGAYYVYVRRLSE